MYPALAVYSKVGFVELAQRSVFGFPYNVRTRYYTFYPEGKRQAPPDTTLKTPVELMPQVDSIPATGHSESGL